MSSGLINTFIASLVTVFACGLGGLPFVFIKSFPDNLAGGLGRVGRIDACGFGF